MKCDLFFKSINLLFFEIYSKLKPIIEKNKEIEIQFLTLAILFYLIDLIETIILPFIWQQGFVNINKSLF